MKYKLIVTLSLSVLFVKMSSAQNTFPATGNVGIGTSTPTALLNVNGGNVRVFNPGGGYPYGVNIDVNYTTSWAREFGISRNGTGKLFSFGVFGGSDGSMNYGYIGGNTTADAPYLAPWMTFKPTGFIGIGTVAPTAILDIQTIDTTQNFILRMENKSIPNSLLYMGTFPGTSSITAWRKENVIESYNDLHISAANTGRNIFFETGRTGLDPQMRMVIDGNGNVGVGTMNTKAYKLAVEGTIGARKVKVTAETGWADFVFDKNYKLPALKEVAGYIEKNGHLQDVPTEADVKENGVDLAEVNKVLLQKVEELTLYMIEMKKESDKQKARIAKLEAASKKK